MNDSEYYVGNFNSDDRDDVASIKITAKTFIDAMQEHCPPGRRLSAACTHVEEAAMLAVKSLFQGA